jgi:hypothetical protein
MSCLTKVVQDIINSCQSVKGLKPYALWAYRSDVVFTYDENEITAVTTPILGTIQAIKFGLNAGNEEVTYEDAGSGFKHKFMATINRTFTALDEADDIVVFVQNNSGVWLAYGAENGLWKASQAKMSNDNLASIAVEFSSRTGMEETYSEYVVTADLSAIITTTDYELIGGLSIPSSGKAYLEVNSDKTCFVVLPNGTLLTSTSGVINTTSPTAGNVKLIIPKGEISTKLDNGVDVFADFTGSYECNNLGSFSAASSDLISIKVNNKTSVSVGGSVDLDVLECESATAIYATNCALTAKSIGDFLIAAYTNNPTASGTANFTGGTNADLEAVSVYMQTQGYGDGTELWLTTWIGAELATWNIDLN